MTGQADQLDTEAALRTLLQSLPQVAAGLKRPGVPAQLQVLFTRLGPRHIPVLSYLLLEGPMSVRELADRLGLAMPTTSLMIRDLETAELVDRAEDPADRRRRLVGIRDDHRDTIEGWLAQRARPIRAALERLSPAQRWAFSHGMQLLAEEFNRQTPATSQELDT
jgi:DNA-binding MarR family transcriptional regulator